MRLAHRRSFFLDRFSGGQFGCNLDRIVFTNHRYVLLSRFCQHEYAKPAYSRPEQGPQASNECQGQSSDRRETKHLNDEHGSALVSSEVSWIECARDIYELCQCFNCERSEQTDLCSE